MKEFWRDNTYRGKWKDIEIDIQRQIARYRDR